ncbi:helix-turn-helix domain-containing protein [Peptostreptococcus porci]|uniref:helix-turn-helix domain-containing protein n=1 Tax=Peptostreptococcus porci TaxID=2652282 RepID=UPI0023F4C3BF|nr:helix-turn-helix transcriptional regulator [Peptostreptococcus porci]MDD7182351.1 helix-turn-helix transcriptional regulator [Peptostreptococcus porci]
MSMQMNIYKTARKAAGLTQEKAAEYLHLSVESLYLYEKGERTPDNNVVVAMAELYNFQLLCYQHLRECDKSNCLPKIECKSLSQAALMLLRANNNINQNTDKFLQIAYDNEVSEDEIEDWQELLKLIDELREACLTVKYCKYK